MENIRDKIAILWIRGSTTEELVATIFYRHFKYILYVAILVWDIYCGHGTLFLWVMGEFRCRDLLKSYRVFVLNVFNFLLNHFTLLTCSNFTRKREMNIVQFALLLFILFFRLLEVIAGKFCHDNDRSSQALYSKSVKL